MAFIDAITRAAKAALLEIEKGNQGSGGTDLTGRVWFDIKSESVWFEVQDDKYGVTNWVSLDFPEYAAPGEKAVVAVDEDDMRNFDANRQPPATYCVGGSDIEGLEPDEVLYSGMNKEEARATLAGVIDLGEPEKYNYWMKREPRP